MIGTVTVKFYHIRPKALGQILVLKVWILACFHCDAVEKCKPEPAVFQFLIGITLCIIVCSVGNLREHIIAAALMNGGDFPNLIVDDEILQRQTVGKMICQKCKNIILRMNSGKENAVF